MERRRLIVSAPRGSGGAYTHLSHVLPRLAERCAQWTIELYAMGEVIERCGVSGGSIQPKRLAGGAAAARLRWEFVDLPTLLIRDRTALVYAPFGPPLNLGIAPRTVWMSRNVIPLLDMAEWEVGNADRARLTVTRGLVTFMARRARSVICVSQHARARLAALARIPADRIAVVPHGVTLPSSASQASEEGASRYLLHVGQAIPYRRTRELLTAFKTLTTRLPAAPPLYVVGKARAVDETYERVCRSVVEPLERDGRVRWLGECSHDEVLRLMAGAYAFVYPSVHEDCPNVVLEALAAAKPSVFADIPAIRELADDGALYVRDPRERSLIEALERIIFDQPLRERLAAEARRRAALFSWDRTIERTAHVLESAFDGLSPKL